MNFHLHLCPHPPRTPAKFPETSPPDDHSDVPPAVSSVPGFRRPSVHPQDATMSCHAWHIRASSLIPDMTLPTTSGKAAGTNPVGPMKLRFGPADRNRAVRQTPPASHSPTVGNGLAVPLNPGCKISPGDMFDAWRRHPDRPISSSSRSVVVFRRHITFLLVFLALSAKTQPLPISAPSLLRTGRGRRARSPPHTTVLRQLIYRSSPPHLHAGRHSRPHADKSIPFLLVHTIAFTSRASSLRTWRFHTRTLFEQTPSHVLRTPYPFGSHSALHADSTV